MRDNVLWKFFFDLLFLKQPVSIRSSFGIQESVRRLSKDVYWPFPNLFRQCLYGRATSWDVQIRRVIPFVGNSFAPVFHGSFQERDGATVLEGYFAMSLFVRVFNGIGFGFCSLMVPLFLAASIFGRDSHTPPIIWWQRLLFGLIPIAMLLYLVALVKVGKWFARNDAAFIEKRIQIVLNEDSN